jgi:L-lactate dehydrogenase complex protein LldE
MIGLFIPCIVDQFYPEVGESVVEILGRLDLKCDYPESQTCCGLPFYNMGYWEAATRPARHFIDVFDDYDAVVTPSSSCASMVKRFFLHLFDKYEQMLPRAKRLAERTHELSSFLVNELKATDVGANFDGSVTCHRSCHLRELGARDEAETLLRHVRGAKFIPLPRTDVCCGFGGSFAVKFPVLSGAMGATKCETFEECNADCVVTTDAGCMMQINGLLRRRESPRRVHHLAELLANRIEPGIAKW